MKKTKAQTSTRLTLEAQLPPFINSDEWWMQEKHDGFHVQIRKAGVEVTATYTETPTNLDPMVKTVAKLFHKNYLVDGEHMTGVDTYYVYDILELDGKDLRKLSYQKRFAILESMMAEVVQPNWILTPTAKTAAEKTALLKKLKEGRKEGVVFKSCTAIADYHSFRFYASAIVKVARVYAHDDCDIDIATIGENGEEIIGSIDTPTSKHFEEGDHIAIRYDYYDAESLELIHPVFVRKVNKGVALTNLKEFTIRRRLLALPSE